MLEARALLRSGHLSAMELVEACLRRIEAANGGEPSFDGAVGAVNAWVRLYPEAALAQARAADRRLRGRHAPALCGIPVGLKDLFAVRGVGLTASSRVLTGNVARADSVVWRRLRAAGAVRVGHTHTHEFGLGATTDQVGNPWALPLSGGGSSGGSAVALAAGMVPAATGTDTGGSLRFPALLCGISTIKPTRGRVPMHGVIPVAPSLDHAGPMARSVADCAALLQVMGDYRDRLPTKARRGHRPLAGLRIAVTDRLAGVELDPEVVAGLTRARRALEHLGARVLSLRAPERAGVGDSGYDRIFSVEVWAHQRRYADRAQLYRPAIAELVARASTVPAGPGYRAALRARAAVGRRWTRWFHNQRVDLLLEPTAPIHAVRRNDPSGADAAAALVATAPLWNATGFPVVAMPAGLGRDSGLPVGVSLIGRHGAEATLIRVGLELQAGPLPPPGRVRLRSLPAG